VGLIDVSASEGAFATGTVEDTEEAWTVVAGILAAVVLTLLAQTLATGACFKGVADAYLGSRPDWRTSLAYVARRLHSIVWVSVLTYVLGFLALLALVVPGVYLFIAWTVAVPVLLTEDVRGMKALGRSRRLTRGFWWRTFAVVLLGSLLSGVIDAIVGTVVGAVLFTGESDLAIFTVDFLGGTVGSVITTPLIAAFVVVLYIDLRVRKEGFDLQLLAERIGLGGVRAQPELLSATRPAPAEGTGDQPPFWPPPPGWKPRDDAERG
jgi:hypothetical protein